MKLMAEKTLTVLLIEDSPEYSALVQRWLQVHDGDYRFTLHWCDTLAFGLERLSKGGVDVVLLDLGLPDSDGPGTLAAVLTEARHAPVIVLSGADSENLALEMIQRGAQDYLMKPTCTGEQLRRALRYTMVRRSSTGAAQAIPDHCRIIAVVGASGGVGATTVAATLAADLRFSTGQSALLLDLDLQGAMVPFVLGLECKHSIYDALQRASSLDADLWQEMVTVTQGDLAVLGCRSPGGTPTVDHTALGHLVRKVRTLYDWIVVDTGRMGPLAETVASWATDSLLVSSRRLGSLHQSKVTIDRLIELGCKRDRIQVVINQRDEHGDLSEREVDRMFGVSVIGHLPMGDRDLNQALIEKRLPAPRSPFRREMTRIALHYNGLSTTKEKLMPYLLKSISGHLNRRRNAGVAAG
jgi:Flp pilus assembly CpaE family ATPase